MKSNWEELLEWGLFCWCDQQLSASGVSLYWLKREIIVALKRQIIVALKAAKCEVGINIV